MNKYYVYVDKDTKARRFIDEEVLGEFATSVFNAELMEFTGVAVEAASIEYAIDAFDNPSAGAGQYYMADEPKETSLVRQTEAKLTNISDNLDVLRCLMSMKLAASKLHEANQLMNEVANTLHKVYKEPQHMTPAMIFKAISDEVVKQAIVYKGKQQ